MPPSIARETHRSSSYGICHILGLLLLLIHLNKCLETLMIDVRDRISPYLNTKKKIIACTIFTLKIQKTQSTKTQENKYHER